MKDLFAECPNKLHDINWSSLGFPSRTGEQSTFWMGSVESFTPCHYDSYGCNLVAQLYGRKKWLLFSPTQSDCLYPTRVPYEESSVFSPVNFRDPDHDKFPKFENATCYEVILEPGDVLFVPKHWWHYVECLETAISVNTWIEMHTDNYDRIEEAITRSLIYPLKSQEAKVDALHSELWLNPSMKEEDLSFPASMQYLRQALKQYHLEQMKVNQVAEPTESDKLSEDDFIKTVVSPDVVRIIAKKLVELTKATP
ncbi:HSPB1-associated protein 1-like isoform X2 [Dendronephthya gigantea]|nr:HSPB1-associated protein 1-like isoform X2 [Dendronephthya gigantea]